ncbi:very short patch repair endonuclease [Actinomycetospora callitridis]|uniref:very short patch repair endonuclease n=1 Tax=Actinomycetospora callitridis TaxID=913944 RepID=UPI0023672198|nr:very short patch repair endonuclease [Actinomycetospora callitridis]MDD7919685.1 very short patch repair endonuclease [Actinomycetospora callitridis]
MRTPTASDEATRKRMTRQRRVDTKPEQKIRGRLHALGYRYRIDFKIAGGRRRADIVFTRKKVAIFIDGCFWHACPQHGSLPKRNSEWWRDKLAANVARDATTDRELASAGWTVVRVWEHEDPESAVRRLEPLLTNAAQGPKE